MGWGLLLLFTFALLSVCGMTAMGLVFISGAMAEAEKNYGELLTMGGLAMTLGVVIFGIYLWYLYFTKGTFPFHWLYLVPPGVLILYTIGLGASLGG